MQNFIPELKDSVLLKRFKIDAPLAEGAFGKIYSGVDLLENFRPIVIKFSQCEEYLENEFRALTEIASFQSQSAAQFSELTA